MKCSLPVTVWSDRREGRLSAGLQRMRRADAPSGETPWSFVTPWLFCPGFIICLCLNSSCQVQPTTTLLKEDSIGSHSGKWLQTYPQNTFFLEYFFFFKLDARGEMLWPLALRHKQVYLMFGAAPAFVLKPVVQWKAAVGVTSGICCSPAPLIGPSAYTAGLLSTRTDWQTHKCKQKDALLHAACKGTWVGQCFYAASV